MKTLFFFLLAVLFQIGHSYAGELDKAPHERGSDEQAIILEYQKLLNGENPLTVVVPTDEYGQSVNLDNVLDADRLSGKGMGRSPAVLGVEEMTQNLLKSGTNEK